MALRLVLIIACYALSTVAYAVYLFRQRDRLQRIGHGLLMVGFGVHSVSLVYVVLQSGALPVRNLHETLSIAAWSVTGVYLLFQYRLQLKILGVYAAPLATMPRVQRCVVIVILIMQRWLPNTFQTLVRLQF